MYVVTITEALVYDVYAGMAETIEATWAILADGAKGRYTPEAELHDISGPVAYLECEQVTLKSSTEVAAPGKELRKELVRRTFSWRTRSEVIHTFPPIEVTLVHEVDVNMSKSYVLRSQDAVRVIWPE